MNIEETIQFFQQYSIKHKPVKKQRKQKELKINKKIINKTFICKIYGKVSLIENCSVCTQDCKNAGGI